jgi:RNA polymerase sigma-70 factor, ECF subfamily
MSSADSRAAEGARPARRNEATAVADPDAERIWVDRARTGDAEAIGRLYERYFPAIYRYIYMKVGNPTEAEDLTEQVFVRMIEAIGKFQWQGASFAAWLYRIAHNQVADTFRRQARYTESPIEALEDVLPSERDDPQDLAERSDSRMHLIEAIGRLTDLQAQVIRLKFGAGLSNAEVAAIMSRTEGAVKALQYSALENLSKIMSAKGYSR